MRLEISGRAMVNCAVRTDGALEDCGLESEDPPDYGFGAAAMKMTPLFRMRPMTKDGVAVAGARVRIPFRFELPADLPPPPPPPPAP
jgi:protein TonB